MLSELLALAERFYTENVLLPIGYKKKAVTWIVEIAENGKGRLSGPFKKNDIREFHVPSRGDRSGKVGSDNLKPYLLVDNGMYALGVTNGNQQETTMAHKGFVDVMQQAYEATQDTDLGTILRWLHDQDALDQVRQQVKAKEIVAFRINSKMDFPFDRSSTKQFWADYLKRDLESSRLGMCSGCGTDAVKLVRLMPGDLVVLGQDCQFTSFNLSAFRSFGKDQTTNAPLCYQCANSITQALDYIIRTRKHHAVIVRDNGKRKDEPSLQNQLAVFWLKQPMQTFVEGQEISWEAVLGAVARPERRQQDETTPEPELSQLEALLKIPWTVQESAKLVRENSFYLAVLSANKTRLVVRDWMSASLSDLHKRLTDFLDALRIIDPFNTQVRAFSIPALLESIDTTLTKKGRARVRTTNANLVRGLLRTAYLGTPPPHGLLEAAVQRFRVPKTFDDPAVLHRLASILKFVTTYGKENAQRMERLDTQRHEIAYLCGRLFAILEEAQRRASSNPLNATLVDRYYSGVSTAPATTLSVLLNQAHTAHLPKIRRTHKGYGSITTVLEEVLTALDKQGGLPRTLPLTAQTDFALGFYHQRVSFKPKVETKA
jgi:CRISPR-associated protein Csd1